VYAGYVLEVDGKDFYIEYTKGLERRLEER